MLITSSIISWKELVPRLPLAITLFWTNDFYTTRISFSVREVLHKRNFQRFVPSGKAIRFLTAENQKKRKKKKKEEIEGKNRKKKEKRKKKLRRQSF